MALEVLNIVEEEKIIARANGVGEILYKSMLEIANETQQLKNVRSIGAIAAADLVCEGSQRIGFEVYQQAVKMGALLRPLGNTIYWFPPLNIEPEVIYQLKEITQQAIEKVNPRGYTTLLARCELEGIV